ncbi:MAG: aryl-sulfate sulfotransferase [Chitinophagaceae bacterium]
MNSQKYLWGVLLCAASFSACQKGSDNRSLIQGNGDRFTQTEITDQKVVLNPGGYAPLSCSIDLKTNKLTRATIRVSGKHGSNSDVVKVFDELDSIHHLDVLGLYAAYQNTVELDLYDIDNHLLGKSAIWVQTEAAPTVLPQITINKSSAAQRPGMNLVSYWGKNETRNGQVPFIFDEYGDLRWYLDFNTHPALKNLVYDDGMERLRNGNWYFGDISSGQIYEVDMMGNILNTWPLQANGYTFHHEVYEKPDGNFLVTVTKNGLATVEDHIIEIDRNTKAIINVWDLRQSLQPSRNTLTADISDWIHVNAVWYDETDNTILVSGRTQGVVKLDQGNHVVWILGPHRGWGIAGDGTDLSTKLLTPLDATGNKITDTSVLNGWTNDPGFEWNWYQHAIKKNQAGHYTMFDNGDNRNFSGFGTYSRALEFAIDPVNRTVQQVWSYGKSRGAETFSRIVSDVDFYPDVNHVIFSPGASVDVAGYYGKIVELDYSSQAILFEATLRLAGNLTIITHHRTERLSLYP